VTALHLSVICQHADVVQQLINHGAKVNHRPTAVAGKRTLPTPLYLAAKNCDLAMARCLVEAGADVRRSFDDGWTALHAASDAGHPDMVEFLLEAGANVSAGASFDDYRDVLALHQAAQNGHVRVLEMLIAAGSDVNAGRASRLEAGIRSIHLAAEQNHLDNVKRLIGNFLRHNQSQGRT